MKKQETTMAVKQIEKELLKPAAPARAKPAEWLLHSLDELSEAENERLRAREALRRQEETSPGDTR